MNGLGWKLDDFTKEMSEFAKFPEDSKFSALDNRIKELLYENGSFKKEERLIIFTEYKDTQAYITRQLELKKLEEPVVQLLYGGAPSEQRMKIKTNFNDLKSPLKILIATDAASEGLNLQSACRFIIHYEIPWNPTRLEQRNGRVDRHGQSKQVIISHFTSKNDEDHEFLSKIVFKVNTIREDLGSFGDVIDIEIIKHFNKKDPDTFEVVEQELSKIASQDERLKLLKTDTKINYHDAYQQLLNSQEQLNLHPDTLRDILAETLKLDGGNIECKTMEDSEKKHTFSYCLITDPIPANWEELIKKSLRKDSALLKLVFNPDSLELRENEIRIFRIPNDVAYIKLSHPIIKRSVNTIQRSLWESSDNPKNNKISRWTINKLNMSKRLGQILVLYYSVTCYNNLGEIADNMVSEEPFIIDRTGLTSLDLKLWSNIKNEEKITLSNQELDSWKKQLLPLWSQFRKLLNEYIDQKTNEKKQYYNDLFLESKNYFADLEKRILNDRLKDLELENNPKPTKSKNLLANYKQKNLLYFLEEHLQQIKVESFTDDIVWERDEKTLELLKEYLKSENKRILEEVLPKRYSVKRIDIRPIGIEILVDV